MTPAFVNQNTISTKLSKLMPEKSPTMPPESVNSSIVLVFSRFYHVLYCIVQSKPTQFGQLSREGDALGPGDDVGRGRRDRDPND